MSAPFGPAVRPADELPLETAAAFLTENPFGEGRVAATRRLLGDAYVGNDRVLGLTGAPAPLENLARAMAITRPVIEGVRDRLAVGAPATPAQLRTYRNAAIHDTYERFDLELQHVAETGVLRDGVFEAFSARHKLLFGFPGSTLVVPEPEHLFALSYKARRLFSEIYTTILGPSLVTAGVRCDLWNEGWEGDPEGYAEWGFDRGDHSATLIIGPTGSGKEGAARVLGRSRYIAFTEAKGFASRPDDGFHMVNISAVPVELADSILFGHVKGAFTGAIANFDGMLSRCKDGGTLFLDEIGDLHPTIQVKLLRVLQEWVFSRLGDNELIPFRGRIIASVQPSLVREGRLREDLYYRLCENLIELPSLRARIADDPAELRLLVRAFAEKKAGPRRAEALTEEVLRVIAAPDLRHHDWPGNIRELKTCVSNVKTHQRYVPRSRIGQAMGADLVEQAMAGMPSMEDVRRRYARAVFAATGDVMDTAKLLGLDRKTVRSLLDLPRALTPAKRVKTRGA